MSRTSLMIVCASVLASAQSPPPAAIPKVLLSSPVNATWAANHPGHFQEKGIDGFLFQGLLSTCVGDIWSGDGDASSKGNDDLLLKEIRVAHLRLADAGIGDNFLLTSLPRGFRGFEDAASADTAVAGLREAAEFCGLAGLSGIAIDSRSSDLFYHPLWDGYSDTDFATLDGGALAFGRRLVEGVQAGYAECKIIIIFDGAMESGPLWPAFFSGAVQALHRLRLSQLEIFSRSASRITDAGEMLRTWRIDEEYLTLRLPETLRAAWQERGARGPGLRPLTQPLAGGEIYAEYPPEAFCGQLVMAKLLAERYVWIESGGQTWWQVQPEEVELYRHTHQDGYALGDQTTAIPTYLGSITARTPVDALARVHAVPARLDAPTVLRGRQGGAAVVWPGQTLRLWDNERSVGLTDLSTREAVKAADGESVLGPYPQPVLVEGLSVSSRVIPASVWLEWDVPALQRWQQPLPVRFGVANPTSFVLEGMLDVIAPLRWTLNASPQRFVLEPGNALTVEGAVRGRFEAGGQLEVRTNLVLPGAEPVRRIWQAEIPPRLRWHAGFAGPVTSAPVWADVDGDSRSDLLVTTLLGELVCLDGDGAVQWGDLMRRGCGLPPCIGRSREGWLAVAAVDLSNTLRIYRGDGKFLTSLALPEQPRQALIVAELDAGRGDELLVAYPSGLVQAVGLDGSVVWEYRTGQMQPHVNIVSGDGGDGDVIASAGESLILIEKLGKALREVRLGAPASCAPVGADIDGDGVMEIWLGSRAGTVFKIEADTVDAIDGLPLTGPVTSIHIGTSNDTPMILVGDGVGLHCFNADWQERWSWGQREAWAPVMVGEADDARILASGSNAAMVVCLTLDGEVEWSDTAALWGPLSAPAVIRTSGGAWFAYGSGEGILRVREMD